MGLRPLRALSRLSRGESYWRVVLHSGRTWSELDQVDDLLRGKRALNWYLDLVATGDVKQIAELWLHTPTGDFALRITSPGTAYQLRPSSLFLGTEGGGKRQMGQIIGRVDEQETGLGVAFIWDSIEQRLYQDVRATVHNFASWRPGVAPLGKLDPQVLGLTLF